MIFNGVITLLPYIGVKTCSIRFGFVQCIIMKNLCHLCALYDSYWSLHVWMPPMAHLPADYSRCYRFIDIIIRIRTDERWLTVNIRNCKIWNSKRERKVAHYIFLKKFFNIWRISRCHLLRTDMTTNEIFIQLADKYKSSEIVQRVYCTDSC